MSVTFYTDRREGPEAEIEDAVLDSRAAVCGPHGFPSWVAASLRLGAGMPDLSIVGFREEVRQIEGHTYWSVPVVAYLRVVRRATPARVAVRLAWDRDFAEQVLDALAEAGIASGESGVFTLNEPWRDILPEVVTVEAKVSHWRRAVEQAARNRIFSHRSFVALPDAIARRVYRDELFRRSGVGVLAVGETGEVRVQRRARGSRPRVWDYYYELALELANDIQGESGAV